MIIKKKEIQRKLLGQILLERKLVNESQLKEAFDVQKINGKALGDILRDLGHTTNDLIMTALSDYLGLEIVSLAKVKLKPDVLNKIPPAIAQLYRVIPIAFEDSTLTLTQEYALNIGQIDDLRFLLPFNIKPVLVDKTDVADALEKYYPGEHESVKELMDKFQHDTSRAADKDTRETEVIETEHLKELANEAPVKTFVNLILLQAIIDKASDVHFEAFENEFRVRCRIDGVLLEKIPVPAPFVKGIVSRIKVMASMDIAERRLPQDGRILLTTRGNVVDIRVSTLPTKYGESIVLRILDKGSTALDLTLLGMTRDDTDIAKKLMEKPNGIVLVTGPTGSGKTTTLYACLSHVNIPGIKIITAEDPVEYDIDGIMQIQVKPEIDVTFASCLRAMLRQDPDKILVGEIRDLETLEIAVQASLTGHLVLSTLHTNDAPSAITRLLNMGLKPYLITASLLAVISQRLVRKICPECKEEYRPGKDIFSELKIPESELKGRHFYIGKGCSNCDNTGYRGRMAIVEIMETNDEINSLIIEESSTETIKKAARKNGMRTLLETGLNAASNGLTTLEELIRETNVN
ncbi:MAG: Flp pilus assembly complex ATPase component TadA [Candidatus Scalindua sediminis]|nr:Flp pilus assembly complex ATPase component TadA [Candidatus Scalindua sediminis]